MILEKLHGFSQFGEIHNLVRLIPAAKGLAACGDPEIGLDPQESAMAATNQFNSGIPVRFWLCEGSY